MKTIFDVKNSIENERINGSFFRMEDAPEDAIESRWSWDELKETHDKLYYLLMEIETFIENQVINVDKDGNFYYIRGQIT